MNPVFSSVWQAVNRNIYIYIEREREREREREKEKEKGRESLRANITDSLETVMSTHSGVNPNYKSRCLFKVIPHERISKQSFV